MKKSLLGAALAAVLLAPSCQDLFSSKKGCLEVRILNPVHPKSSSGPEAIPDTDDFILKICDSEDRILYEGRFGDSPEKMELAPGSYSVSAYSSRFESPAFACPQYGDSQIIVLKSGENVCAELYCTQINSGIKLDFQDSFRYSFPDADIYMKADSGELIYNYDEERIAYFPPGKITVTMEEEGKSQNLFTRTLEERQIVRISLGAAAGENPGGISVQVDSSRIWIDEEFIYGEDNSGEIWDAFDVLGARDNADKENVWVYGYIVGVATGTNRLDFEAPFDKNTNLVLGLRSVTADKEYCLSVELKAGAIRDELNLADNPGLQGRLVYMKGDLVSAYYGIPGLKNVEEYQFRD